MIVYGSSLSPFVRKVLCLIGEKGLAAEHRPMRPHDPLPEFRAASPLGKIPAFADGGYNLADSSAICHYIERKYPEPALFPSNAEDYGRMVWFEELSDTALVPAGGKIFFNLYVKPKLLGQSPDLEAVEQAWRAELPPLLDYLEGEIAGPFLVGGMLTLADIAVACPFGNLELVNCRIDAARWPKLAGYLDALNARPAFAALRESGSGA